jgi:hypothetical protein
MTQKVRGATGILQAISGAMSAGYLKSSKMTKEVQICGRGLARMTWGL